VTHENAEDLTANILVGRSIGFPRHHSYGRAATVDKIAQPIGKLSPREDSRQSLPAFEGKEDIE
jgi:hypothetical protein